MSNEELTQCERDCEQLCAQLAARDAELAEAKAEIEKLRNGLVLPEDLFTHEQAWRDALVECRRRSPFKTDDRDERAYWEHELAAFERTWKKLHEMRPASAPPEREDRPERPAMLLAKMYYSGAWKWCVPLSVNRVNDVAAGANFGRSLVVEIDEVRSDPAAVALWKQEREGGGA